MSDWAMEKARECARTITDSTLTIEGKQAFVIAESVIATALREAEERGKASMKEDVAKLMAMKSRKESTQRLIRKLALRE